MIENTGKIIRNNVSLKVGPQINSDTVLIYPHLTKNDRVEVLRRIVDVYDESWYYVKVKDNIYGYLPTYTVAVE